ncbi:PoNe immunity protein domain-containing protein [Maribacter sp.]|uniref:PoNe immunity protein domain-containing protein n=1 Tax=Maribacter sp. TaxID=1897614 RepID=UPI0032987010
MRDTLISDLNYYKSFIELQNQLLLESHDRLNNNQIPNDNISNVHHRLFFKKLEIFIASFGQGATIEQLRLKLNNLFDNFHQEWLDDACKLRVKGGLIDQYNLNSYCYMIWFLSISILLGIEKKHIDLLTKTIEDAKIEDELILFLISALNGKEYLNKKETTYRPFKKLVKNNIRDLKKMDLKKYLKSWYQGTKLMTWHHYNPANGKYFYFGKWSFEASAIVAILNIDDNSFKEQENYPHELVLEYRKRNSR